MDSLTACMSRTSAGVPFSPLFQRGEGGPTDRMRGAIVSQFCGKSRPSSACRHLTGASHGSRPPSAPNGELGRRQRTAACCQSPNFGAAPCIKDFCSSACRHLTGASHGSRPPSAPAEVAGRRQLATACCQSPGLGSNGFPRHVARDSLPVAGDLRPSQRRNIQKPTRGYRRRDDMRAVAHAHQHRPDFKPASN